MNNMWANGLNSKQFHAVNIFLHGVVCATFVIFLSVMLGDGKSFTPDGQFIFHHPEISTSSAVLFAVLPVHSESVS
jgi:hypothetical protein